MSLEGTAIRYLDEKLQRGAISPEEHEILIGFIEQRNAIKPTSAETRKKQAYQGMFVVETLHEAGATLDTCTVKDLLKVARHASSGDFTKNSRQTKITLLKALATYIHRFYHKIKDLDLLTEDVKAGCVDKGRKEVLTLDEWETVLNTPMSAKERAMIAMLYDGYHRPSEILLLKWSDLRINERGGIEYEIIFKTEKIRTIVQKGQTTAILEMWRQELGATFQDKGHIFPDRDGMPYETITVLKNLFQRLRLKTGISKLKPSMLRNTAITHDVEAALPTSYICLRAWGEPYNEMINVYSKPDSGRMQAEQHKKAGTDEIPISKAIGRRAAAAVRTCPGCDTSNPHDAGFCYVCGTILSPKAAAELREANQQVDLRPEYRALMKEFEMKLMKMQTGETN